MAPIVFADANVLYAAPVRDLLIELTLAHAIQLHWSDQVQDEWTAALLRQRPDLDPDRVARTRTLMDAALPDARISDFTEILPTLVLPDPDDCHVLAAAIAAKASFLLTFNITDFPDDTLARYQLAAIHPDQFLALLFASTPAPFRRAVTNIHGRLRNPPLTLDAYLVVLAKLGLPNLAIAISRGLTADM